MSRKKIFYLIPGVGADETIFKHIQFPKGYKTKSIVWEKNKNYDEPLAEYVKRLLPQFDFQHDIYLCGLSFGGIVCTELSKIISVKRIIIISSIKTMYERPIKIGVLKYLQFYRFVPGKVLAKINFWHRWAFGKLNREEKQLVNYMLAKIDIPFNEWAVHQAIIWGNIHPVQNMIHIHGDADKIFPINYIRSCHKIKGGTHFMIINKAEEINKIIENELNKELPDNTEEEQRGF